MITATALAKRIRHRYRGKPLSEGVTGAEKGRLQASSWPSLEPGQQLLPPAREGGWQTPDTPCQALICLQGLAQNSQTLSLFETCLSLPYGIVREK